MSTKPTTPEDEGPPLIHPHTGSVALLTRNTYMRHNSSAADMAPPAPRPGSRAATVLPSRYGNQLKYPDGRVVAVTPTTNH